MEGVLSREELILIIQELEGYEKEFKNEKEEEE